MTVNQHRVRMGHGDFNCITLTDILQLRECQETAESFCCKVGRLFLCTTVPRAVLQRGCCCILVLVKYPLSTKSAKGCGGRICSGKGKGKNSFLSTGDRWRTARATLMSPQRETCWRASAFWWWAAVPGLRENRNNERECHLREMSAVSGGLCPEVCDKREKRNGKGLVNVQRGGKWKIFYEVENETGQERQSIWWLYWVLL